MTLQTVKQWILANRKELLSGLAGFGLMLAIWLIFFSLQKPSVTNPPETTKESAVTLIGKAAPNTTVMAFNASGTAMMFVHVDEKGDFTLDGLPVFEGETIYSLRAFDGGLRASFPRIIKIKKDASAPLLQINPFDQSVVTGSNTTISGKAEPGSTVTVNGVKTTVAADGTWTATIALQNGKNTVTVSATDPAGNTTTNTETIQYTPTNPTSPTGTISVSSSTSTTSPSSTPAPTTSPTTAPTTSPTTSPTSQPAPTPAPQPVLSISANAWVSNPTPNERATETVYVSVKDNYGRPVTGASVTAKVYFKTGMQQFTFASQNNGTYSTSFKLNDKFEAGYRVRVESVATYNGFSAIANTSFTGANR